MVSDPRAGLGLTLSAHLQWEPQSSSPPPQHRRRPASLCSGIHSGKEWWEGESALAWAQQSTPPLYLPQCPPYLVDAPKQREELAEKGGTHACDMHKRALGGTGRW